MCLGELGVAEIIANAVYSYDNCIKSTATFSATMKPETPVHVVQTSYY
jgi:hypothetical protein